MICSLSSFPVLCLPFNPQPCGTCHSWAPLLFLIFLLLLSEVLSALLALWQTIVHHWAIIFLKKHCPIYILLPTVLQRWVHMVFYENFSYCIFYFSWFVIFFIFHNWLTGFWRLKIVFYSSVCFCMFRNIIEGKGELI